MTRELIERTALKDFPSIYIPYDNTDIKHCHTPNYLTHEKRRNTGEVDLICIRNHHESIISQEIWDLAQERLREKNKHKGGPVGHSNRYVFSGKIKCGVCGSSFIGKQKTLSDGSVLRRWSCGGERCDVGRLVRDDDAIHMLKTALQNLNIDRKSLIHDVTALALGAVLAGEEVTNDKPGFLCHEMERIQGKKEKLLDSFLDGDISKDDMQAMNRRYDAQMASRWRSWRRGSARPRRSERGFSRSLRDCCPVNSKAKYFTNTCWKDSRYTKTAIWNCTFSICPRCFSLEESLP